MSASSAPELGHLTDEAIRSVDLIVEEIRERMCSRLDVAAEHHGLELEDVAQILRIRQGESYAEDYEDWVLDSTTTDQGDPQ
ncbi:hypothetical protein SEA_BUMBLE_42 [Arthrobacter phage Bumble]|uniref:Uncharacterized protein n=1 Tax=Arthrobacter phage Bumble TaxID=2743904 RepID=A0A7G3VCH8_9CAUD|nr:hypothetical protein SEA_BUMBLE_42 [Arthrobacter phage Bumble]